MTQPNFFLENHKPSLAHLPMYLLRLATEGKIRKIAL